jgi:hypothetical protein
MSENTLGIYITSAGRADKLSTLDYMSASVQAMTTFVVPYDQYDTYKKVLAGTACAVLSPPPDITLMSPKRQWVFMNTPHRFAWIMDDDLDFYTRQDMKLIRATQTDVQSMVFEVFNELTNGTPFVGISSRYGNNTVTEDYKDIGRVSRCWALDVEIYRQLGISITPFPEYCIDDFHIILSFLEHGYSDRIFYKFSQSDKGSNSAGGCSTYRNYDVQYRSALWLAEQHPQFVTMVEKETKHAWPGMKKNAEGKNVRMDVNVQWAKAYRQGKLDPQGGLRGLLAGR